jgi:DNA-binding NtrC family response regulator
MSGKRFLTDRCVLIIEDEIMVTMMLEDMLQELGAGAIETATNLEEAESRALDTVADVALVDVNLHGRMSYPAAEILNRRGIPFLFATGYGPHMAELSTSPWGEFLTLQKPFVKDDLEVAIRRVMRLPGD